MASNRSRWAGPLLQLVVATLFSLWLIPDHWYSDAMRIRLAQWFGTPSWQPPGLTPNSPTLQNTDQSPPVDRELVCPEDLGGWRQAQRLEGVEIGESLSCVADNPYAVAAFVRGTNNVSMETLMAAGLTPDAVEKGRDLDGDGDPDEIHLRLEVIELNGASPDIDAPVTAFEIAPGITPGLWVFAPKTFGMATTNFASNQARELLRPPSPTIRIEQGDRVLITLENTHYLPHTIHFHGVDHGFIDSNGEGNDGVPVTSELPVEPGRARTYELQPRHAGTMFYHCHVQVQVHVMMGLQGMFVVEENRPNNWLQTLNVGAGHVRVPSASVRENYAAEYDLDFTDLDSGLNNLIQQSNDPRQVEQLVNRGYDITDADSDYFLLNGRSFPLTFQESLIVTEPDQRVKLRVLNGGSVGLALHTHGHKPTATHYDGVALGPQAQVTRDVFWLASAQRTDLELNTVNDGLHAYGSGVWLLHDHQERAVTNDGLGPGGNLGAIVYKEFLDQDGWPRTRGEDLARYFQPDFYRRRGTDTRGDTNKSSDTSRNSRTSQVRGTDQPVRQSLPAGLFLQLLGLGIALGAVAASLVGLVRAVRSRTS
ncbi:MAG: multicopper oxidase domain-containing protein [Pseudomonadales bacterium]|nr:multicopper oxidase domain-containing protein [Pseudomonadales bacterium]